MGFNLAQHMEKIEEVRNHIIEVKKGVIAEKSEGEEQGKVKNNLICDLSKIDKEVSEMIHEVYVQYSHEIL